MTTATAIAMLAAVLAALLLVLVVRLLSPRFRAPHDALPAMTLLQNQVNAGVRQNAQQLEALQRTLADSLQTLQAQLAQSLSESNQTVGRRLDHTSRVIGDVRQQLGQLEQSSQRMLEVGKDISRLEQVLRAPKLRGSLGELFLAELLGQILPPEHYTLQHAFKGGETVDAVVRLQAGLVPIDAKFPLENFQRIFRAETEDARKAARKAFSRDVRVHIDAIAAKYIRPDEGTFAFALMYIPAENVYYETIIKDEELGGDMALFHHALRKRVIPVSPNSFYAYLQTILLGLKGLQVEEQARDILQAIARLHQEFLRFADTFRLVGSHLDNAARKYADAQQRFSRVEARLDRITGLAQDEDPAAAPDRDGGQTPATAP